MFDVVTIGTGTRDVFVSTAALKSVRDPGHLKRLGFRTGTAQCLPAGAKTEIEAPLVTIGGGAVNAAVTFARQGLKTAAVLKIGKDEAGDLLLKDLRREKISPVPAYDKAEQTAYSVILLSADGERTILHHRGASRDLKDADVPFGRIKSRWAYIVPGHISPAVLGRIVGRLRKGGTKIAINPSEFYVELGARKLKTLLENADVLLMNREEASVFTGVPYRDEAGIFRAFDKLVPGLAVMTEGAEGVRVSDGKKIFHAGIFPDQNRKDRTGAGDAFGSGFVAALARARAVDERSIKEAIRLGTANAAAVVEHVGTVPGILTKKQFAVRRWRTLPVHIKNL